MPIGIEPGQTFRVSLASDRDKPLVERPWFAFGFLTARRWRQLSAISDEAENDPGGENALDRAVAALKTGLVDWGNMKMAEGGSIVFDPETIEDILTITELRELFWLYLAQEPDADQKKTSAPPSP